MSGQVESRLNGWESSRMKTLKVECLRGDRPNYHIQAA